MKKILSIILVLIIGTSLTACGGKEIPDVFGINFNDAIEILEAEGYEVNAVETSVEEISEKLLYPLETVSKGTVFKIDDYILDNNGNLTKDYDVFYEGELVSEDDSLVIYYAKEDYILCKEEEESAGTSPTEESAPETTEALVANATEQQTQASVDTDDTAIGSDFKAAMDSYENFMNDYVDFMKKYSENPADMSLLTDYADYMSKYAEFVADFEKWDSEDLNTAEAAYYIEVQARVNQKLLEVAQ